MIGRWEIVALVGIALIVAGFSLWSPAAAVVVLGSFVLIVGILGGIRWASSGSSQKSGTR